MVSDTNTVISKGIFRFLTNKPLQRFVIYFLRHFIFFCIEGVSSGDDVDGEEDARIKKMKVNY